MTGSQPGPLGRGVVVRTLVVVTRGIPAGTIGLVIGQAKSGSKRYRVMFPGDPCDYSLAAKQIEVVRGLDPQSWWKKPSGSWINEDRFAPFREALSYARGHFSRATFAFAKVTAEDAYWIHSTIQQGFARQHRQALLDADARADVAITEAAAASAPAGLLPDASRPQCDQAEPAPARAATSEPPEA